MILCHMDVVWCTIPNTYVILITTVDVKIIKSMVTTNNNCEINEPDKLWKARRI